jgi:hypothetical protein
MKVLFRLKYFFVWGFVVLNCNFVAALYKVDNVFGGFEYIELSQNSFRNIGKDNHTYFLGFSKQIDKKTLWGIHYAGMNVELSEKHLQDPSPFYKGDFAGVNGRLNVQRLYLDYYYRWDFGKIWIEPIVSLGAGRNSWFFDNTLTNENYYLKTYSMSLAGKFRFTFFQYPFIEIGSIDAFAFVKKNRNPEQFLGNAHIAFNKYGGLFNWIFLGVNFPLVKK